MNLRNKIPFFLANIKRDKTQPIWLEYLQSDTSAFIDTGVSGNNNNLSLNMTFYVEKFYEYGGIFGNYIDENTNAFRVIGSENSSKLYFNVNTRAGSEAVRNVVNFFGSKHTLHLGGKKLILDGTSSSALNVNGTVNDTNIALFNRSVANPYPDVRDIGLKIYSCQMYDGDVMIRDFRPCLHPKTLQPCMYDMVTKQYFFNAGTGQFKYEYTFDTLEYIESTGTQYIDTGALSTASSKWEVDFQSNKAVGATFESIFGAQTNVIIKRLSCIIISTNDAARFVLNNSIKDEDINFYSVEDAHSRHIYGIDVKAYTVYVDNTKIIGTEATNLVTDYPIYVLARNDGGTATNFAKGKLYGFKHYKDYILVADYIPVRKLDGTVCMYDFISGEFKTNAGSGTFVAGGYAQNLEDYEKLDYLTFTGTQQLKTDVNWRDVYGFSGSGQGNSAMYGINRAVLGSAGYSSANDSYGVRFSGATREWQWNTGIAVEKYVKYSFAKQDGMWVGNVNGIESTVNAELVLAKDTGVQIGASQNARRFIGDIYTQVLFDVDGKPLLIAQPVKRKSDGVKGMFDMVSGAFLTNQGTGEFE